MIYKYIEVVEARIRGGPPPNRPSLIRNCLGKSCEFDLFAKYSYFIILCIEHQFDHDILS